MKESIGGAWLFQIAIVFILLFAGYLAFSINYSRAFNVKNKIIAIIEEQEGMTIAKDGKDGAVEIINKYLARVGHAVDGACKNEQFTGYGAKENFGGRGVYCVQKICSNEGDGWAGMGMSIAHYKLEVFFRFDIPLLSEAFTFRVEGETKTLYHTTDGLECTYQQDLDEDPGWG